MLSLLPHWWGLGFCFPHFHFSSAMHSCRTTVSHAFWARDWFIYGPLCRKVVNCGFRTSSAGIFSPGYERQRWHPPRPFDYFSKSLPPMNAPTLILRPEEHTFWFSDYLSLSVSYGSMMEKPELLYSFFRHMFERIDDTTVERCLRTERVHSFQLGHAFHLFRIKSWIVHFSWESWLERKSAVLNIQRFPRFICLKSFSCLCDLFIYRWAHAKHTSISER